MLPAALESRLENSALDYSAVRSSNARRRALLTIPDEPQSTLLPRRQYADERLELYSNT